LLVCLVCVCAPRSQPPGEGRSNPGWGRNNSGGGAKQPECACPGSNRRPKRPA
jgi:hypothetical protein